MKNLIDFLNELEHHKLQFTLEHNRREAIMVLIAVPGERWEVEFFEDGQIEVEIFKSSGDITDEKSLDRLFAELS
jgi:hypothetical protein